MKKTSCPGWHHADITAALKKSNSSQTLLAQSIGSHKQVVCEVIHGKRRTHYVREAIARQIGMPVAAIWPDAA